MNIWFDVNPSSALSNIWFPCRRGAGGSSKDPHQGEQPRDANANGGGGVEEEWREPRPVALSLAAIRTPPPKRVGAHRTSKTGKRPSQPITGELSSLMLVDRWGSGRLLCKFITHWWQTVIPDAAIRRRCAAAAPPHLSVGQHAS